jgi:hypothetical protein
MRVVDWSRSELGRDQLHSGKSRPGSNRDPGGRHKGDGRQQQGLNRRIGRRPECGLIWSDARGEGVDAGDLGCKKANARVTVIGSDERSSSRVVVAEPVGKRELALARQRGYEENIVGGKRATWARSTTRICRRGRRERETVRGGGGIEGIVGRRFKGPSKGAVEFDCALPSAHNEVRLAGTPMATQGSEGL